MLIIKPVRVSPREQQVLELLLQGCSNPEIAKQLNITQPTVKAHFNRLFLRFEITDGVKRVKLATLFYRRQQCLQQEIVMVAEPQLPENTELLNSLQLGTKTKISQPSPAQPKLLSRTASA